MGKCNTNMEKCNIFMVVFWQNLCYGVESVRTELVVQGRWRSYETFRNGGYDGKATSNTRSKK